MLGEGGRWSHLRLQRDVLTRQPYSSISNISDVPSQPGQYRLCSSMNFLLFSSASALELTLRIAQPPTTSLASVNGPSVTVSLPFSMRSRVAAELGLRPPVSTTLPEAKLSWTNLPMASSSAGGGPSARYFSLDLTNARNFIVVSPLE